MKKIIIIPSRLGSTRLKRKALLDIEGKILVQRVFEQASKSKMADAVYIATDSKEIVDACKKFTNNVLLTSKNCKSGSDRVAEVASRMADAGIIMNVQGDEPFVDPDMLDDIFSVFDKDKEVYMASAMSHFGSVESLKNPNTVCVVTDKSNYGLYFSRSIIPFDRQHLAMEDKSLEQMLKIVRKHIGVYAFTRDFLLKYTQMPQTFLEKTEMLEQLRALENGYKIKMIETNYSSVSVDTQEDLERCRKLTKRKIFK